LNKAGTNLNEEKISIGTTSFLIEDERGIFEFNLLICELAAKYRDVLWERILWIDDVTENEMHRLALKLMWEIEKIGDVIDKDKTKYGLTLAKVNFNKWKYWASLNFFWHEIAESLVEFHEKKYIYLNDLEISRASSHPWNVLMEYTDRMGRFDYSSLYFDTANLSTSSEEYECLKEMIRSYKNCFTLRDSNEEWSKNLNICRDDLSEIKRVNSWFVENYKDIKWYFEVATRENDINEKKEAIKKKDLDRLIFLIWKHARNYFMRIFLEKNIITKEYYLYLKSLKDPWEPVKELYYIIEREEIWKIIIEKTPENIIMNIKEVVAEALKRKPKESYRILNNLKNFITIYRRQVDQICKMWQWLEILMTPPKFSLPPEWEEINLLKEIIILEQ